MSSSRLPTSGHDPPQPLTAELTYQQGEPAASGDRWREPLRRWGIWDWVGSWFCRVRFGHGAGPTSHRSCRAAGTVRRPALPPAQRVPSHAGSRRSTRPTLCRRASPRRLPRYTPGGTAMQNCGDAARAVPHRWRSCCACSTCHLRRPRGGFRCRWPTFVAVNHTANWCQDQSCTWLVVFLFGHRKRPWFPTPCTRGI